MRSKRFELFLSYLGDSGQPIERILDLGGGDGSFIASHRHLLPGVDITIADIDENALLAAREKFGFNIVSLSEQGALPFVDHEFDFVFCNSVIEHVTVPKSKVWLISDGQEFRNCALLRQFSFAQEIRRITHGYFVQTPCRSFPIESHTWLPFVQHLPRKLLLSFLRNLNKWWAKGTSPDWYLLDFNDMKRLFPDAHIVAEKMLGMTKSLIAVREYK